MTEAEKLILSEITDLRRAIDELRSDFSISQISYFENLPPSAIVGIDYVAYKFGVSESAVVRGQFNTNKIRRFRNKPVNEGMEEFCQIGCKTAKTRFVSRT